MDPTEPSKEFQDGMALRRVKLNFKKLLNPNPERKTSAQYQQEYRSKLKMDPERWAEYKARSKVHLRTHLANMSAEQREERKRKKTASQREYRRKKSLEAQRLRESNPTPEPPKELPKKKTRRAVQDQQEYWRQRTRAQREAMTAEERKEHNLRVREKRKLKKASSSSVATETQWDNPLLFYPSTQTHIHPVSYINMTQSYPQFASTPVIQTHPQAYSTPITQIHPLASSTPVTQTHPQASSTPVTQTHPQASSTPVTQTHPQASSTPVTQTHPQASSTPVTQTHPQASSTPLQAPHDHPLSSTYTVAQPHITNLIDTPALHTGPVNPNSNTESMTPQPTLSPSPTKNAKYCALQRVKKSMPRSRKSQLYVMKQLLNACSPKTKLKIFNLSGSLPSDTRNEGCRGGKRGTKKVSILKQNIIKFYEDVALEVPDQKFYSKRLKIQRKVLDRPIKMWYCEFRRLFPSLKVSESNFFKSRPDHVLKMGSLKLRQCLCETCQNIKLCYQPLISAGAPHRSVTDAVISTLCPCVGEWASYECVERTCERCGTKVLKKELEQRCGSSTSVSYQCWALVPVTLKSGKVIKKNKLVSKECTMHDLISRFFSLLEPFSMHRFVDQWQRHQFKSLKESLPLACKLIVLDFAENYTCQYQNQAQSAYYSLEQVTIHPVVVYSQCKACSKAQANYRIYLSDDLKHDAHFVHYVMKDTFESLGVSSKYVIFSDNCSSQYKSRLPMYYFYELAKTYDIERCYFGERHGKSECDSSGGVVKSFLTSSVKSGKVLTNASEIFDHLSASFTLSGENCSHCSRTFHLVGPSAVDRSLSLGDVPPLKGIKSFHSIKFLRSGKLATRQLSCFCQGCSTAGGQCINNGIPSFKEKRWLSVEIEQERKGVNAGKDLDGTCEHVSEAGGSGDVGVLDGENVGTTVIGSSERLDRETSDGCDIVGDVSEEESGDCEVVESCCEDVESKAGGGVNAEVEDGENAGNKPGDVFVDRQSVRRELFRGLPLFKNSVDFKSFYQAIEKCKSFEELNSLCINTELPPISFNMKPVKVNLDHVALNLAPSNSPAGYLPHLTIGDGNCIPRSLSTLFFGSDSRHLEIRCRLTHELVLNKVLYLDRDFLSLGSDIPPETVLDEYIALSDSLGECDLSHHLSIFEREVFDTRLLCKFLGLWHLHAAAQIARCGIISLYPHLGPTQNRNLFARAFVPRSFNLDQTLYILWSSNRQDMRKEHWVANHVVPLVKIFK